MLEEDVDLLEAVALAEGVLEPLLFGMRTESHALGRIDAASTSWASASCGITSGRTELVTSTGSDR